MPRLVRRTAPAVPIVPEEREVGATRRVSFRECFGERGMAAAREAAKLAVWMPWETSEQAHCLSTLTRTTARFCARAQDCYAGQ